MFYVLSRMSAVFYRNTVECMESEKKKPSYLRIADKYGRLIAFSQNHTKMMARNL
jgi:hypothetical protein